MLYVDTLVLRQLSNPNDISTLTFGMKIIGLTKSAAKEVASKKIRVNCLAPGVVETPMATISAGKTAEQLNDEIGGHTPLKRMGTAEEVAKSIAFLLSADSSYTTGAVLTIDGGMSA